jgi:hypothetical protein
MGVINDEMFKAQVAGNSSAGETLPDESGSDPGRHTGIFMMS